MHKCLISVVTPLTPRAGMMTASTGNFTERNIFRFCEIKLGTLFSII